MEEAKWFINDMYAFYHYVVRTIPQTNIAFQALRIHTFAVKFQTPRKKAICLAMLDLFILNDEIGKSFSWCLLSFNLHSTLSIPSGTNWMLQRCFWFQEESSTRNGNLHPMKS